MDNVQHPAGLSAAIGSRKSASLTRPFFVSAAIAWEGAAGEQGCARSVWVFVPG